MGDKSPRQQLSKKSGKSIKEKRAEKKTKIQQDNNSSILNTESKKRKNSFHVPELNSEFSNKKFGAR